MTKTTRKRVDKNAVITILATYNPKRKNSGGHARFELYKDGMTVAEYVAIGGKAADIRYDIAKGNIEIKS